MHCLDTIVLFSPMPLKKRLTSQGLVWMVFLVKGVIAPALIKGSYILGKIFNVFEKPDMPEVTNTGYDMIPTWLICNRYMHQHQLKPICVTFMSLLNLSQSIQIRICFKSFNYMYLPHQLALVFTSHDAGCTNSLSPG